VSASGYNGFNVGFTVNGNGSATKCNINIVNVGNRQVGCNGGTETGLWPATTYHFTVVAVNNAGSDSYNGSVTTPTVTGSVVCTNPGYCGHGSSTGGIWVYTTATQTGHPLNPALFAGAQVTAQCYTTDSQGATINAKPYGGRSSNLWLRISYQGNNYIPYAWVNLNAGAAIGSLPKC
jgi:hypothetical protein